MKNYINFKSMFQQFKNTTKRIIKGLLDGNIKICIIDGYFIYEDYSENEPTIIKFPLHHIFKQLQLTPSTL